MTTEQLRQHFSNTFGINEWPRSYEVDAETYGNVCNDIIRFHLKSASRLWIWESSDYLMLELGKNGGVMFKGVELILKNA